MRRAKEANPWAEGMACPSFRLSHLEADPWAQEGNASAERKAPFGPFPFLPHLAFQDPLALEGPSLF